VTVTLRGAPLEKRAIPTIAVSVALCRTRGASIRIDLRYCGCPPDSSK